MVVFLPKEFMALVDSVVFDEEHGMAQFTLEPNQAIFEKQEDGKRQHLKALFLKGYVNGKPVTRMLVDGGAAVNLMSYTMLRKIGKSDEVMNKTDMMLVDFEGNVSLAQAAICVDLTIGTKTLSTAFFVIKGRGSYNLLLGQDWIHANCCIPSTMHQCII
jgi:predicted aspartyl protease